MPKRKAAVIGVFDGVHTGHKHLIDQLIAEARKRDLEPVALTFDRHPLELVKPEATPPEICSLQERLRRLREAGVEPMVLDFTPELRAMSAQEFCTYLSSLGVELLMMGFNNRIGSDRLSGPELIGTPLEIIVASELPRSGVCSSAIRQAVLAGKMELAEQLLGKPYILEGTVVKGRQIGRTLGFPTANLRPDSPNALLPPGGVYAGRVGSHPAVINIGRRPTLDNGSDISIEAHLLDFQGDLYGKKIKLEFTRRLRSEQKFNSLDELKAQIQKDIENARGK